LYTCLEIADIPIDSGKIGVSVMTVGITVAVVNIAVVVITEEGVATTLVVSGTISVSVMIIEEVGIMIVVSGSIVGRIVDVGEMVTPTPVSFVYNCSFFKIISIMYINI